MVAESSKSAAEPALTADAKHSRDTQLEDLIREQVEQLEADGVALENLKTQFVDSFTRGEIVKRPLRVYGKAKGKRPVQIESESYRVGDTVFVKTVTKEPSIAVITGMWKVVESEKELCLNVALHWFVRPQQLPSVRVRRSHDAVRMCISVCRSWLMFRRMRFIIRCRKAALYQRQASSVCAKSPHRKVRHQRRMVCISFL